MRAINSILRLLALCIAVPPLWAYPQLVVIDKQAYRSVYDLQTLCPSQVFYILHSSDIGNQQREPSWRFVCDINHPAAHARHSDFTRSGYDRGHLCAAQDRSRDDELMRSTFSISNVAAQLPSINRGVWKQTETYCRAAAVLYDSVSVLIFPAFLPRDTLKIGKHRVSVPHAFFKAVWVTKTDSVLNAWYIFNHE